MKTLFALIATTLSLFIISSASAQALYWDPGQTASATAGGSGNWDTTSSFWFDGVSSDVLWTSGDDAFFEGTAGTVTLMQSTAAADLYFTNATGNYYITNATGAEVLTVANTIDTGGGEHTIAVPLSNSSTLNKNGAGRLHLTAANSLNTVTVNQGELSVENNSALGGSATVVDGAALELNGGTNDVLSGVTTSVTINGSGVTNSGSLRNLSGVTTFYGQIVLGENNSVIYADSGSALVCDAEFGPLTDNGNGYNLIISGNGTGNVHLGATSITGTLIVEGPASCYAYLNSITPTDWKSTYISTGGTLFVENNNSFGTDPAALMTTNCIVDGGGITSGGTYTMYANDGITVTTNGGTLTCNSGTWTTCNIYSSNAPVTFTGSGSIHPGGAAGTTLGTINLGTGTFIKGGSGDCNMGFANPSLEIYSNLVLNGGSLSFNYDQSSGQVSSLGAVPSTLNASNIWFSGGSMHVGHSTTIAATRGIYVASGGGTIEDVVSSGGTVTINSPISGPGSMSFPDGHGGTLSTIILAANNTYAGTTTIGISNVLTVGNGSTTGTLGTGNTTVNGPLKFNRTGTYTYGGNISGNSNLMNSGSAVITLTGKMTYVGTTTISAGTLLIDNTNGSSAVTVSSGGTLGGTGTFGGPVTVSAGGKLALGNTTLSFSNNLSIAGNITVNVNKSLTPSNGMAIVTGTLARSGTGTLVVTNLGPSLAVGDTFQLFSQPLSGGGTMAVSGGGAGVVWNNNLAVDGTISVQSVVPPSPRISNVQISNGNIILSGSNGPDNGTYYLLTSTNVMVPLSQWTSVLTNTFLSNGQFFITNPITAGTAQQFYLLQVP